METDLTPEVLLPIIAVAAAGALAVHAVLRRVRQMRDTDDLAARAFERHREKD